MVEFGNEWDELLADEFKKDYYLRLRQFLIQEYRTQRIFPGMYDIFNAFKYTSYNDVKAVIIGQDPYHGVGQAHGLCFWALIIQANTENLRNGRKTVFCF